MRSATVHRLVPKLERASREAVETVAASVVNLPETDLSVHDRRVVLNALQRIASPPAETPMWKFVMISVAQTALVWDAIRALPGKDRPNEVRHAFDLVMTNLRQDTGEVMLNRDELADRMKCPARSVSSAMSVLARLGVITRETRRVDGMRGAGVVAYFINPYVGWNGSREHREEAASRSTPPLLQLMQGGIS